VLHLHKLALASLALAALSACSSETATAPSTPIAAVARASGSNGRHIVTFTANAIPSDFAARVAALGGTVPKSYPQIGVAYADGLTDAQAAGLTGQGGVAQVIPNIEVHLEAPAELAGAEAFTGAAVESQNAPATAFFFARQWDMRAIHADAGWAAGKLGSSAVRIGILDTGIDYTHLDLAGRVDMAASRSFVPSDAPLVQQYFPGRPDWIDLHFHGTHVAATVSSNAVAAAGVTSRTTLVAIKVLGATGSSQGSSVLDGIMYAASPLGPDGAGVDVINMSLGGTFDKRDEPGYVAVINRAINYAHDRGVTVVVSAGNSGADLDHDKNGYKAYCSSPNVICVSATGPTAQTSVNGPYTNVDAVAGYSNYGRSAINVAAPGGYGTLTAGVSFVYEACSHFSLVPGLGVCGTGTFVLGVQGTSQAAPHVSGLAALLVEQYGRNPDAIKSAIQSGADDLGPRGTDPGYGKGRINVAGSLGL
jgi:subtilisin family serine protease